MIQLIASIVLMYSVVLAAGLWAKRRRAELERLKTQSSEN